MLGTELARTEGLLYRRGTFGGTLDDLICDALLAERDAEIALSPGFRWGGTLIPGQAVTWEDVYNATAITYPAAYRSAMTGETIKLILEDVADNLFNPDPVLSAGRRHGAGGRHGLHRSAWMPRWARASPTCTFWVRVRRSRPSKTYVVAGWGSRQRGHARSGRFGMSSPPISRAGRCSRRSRASR